MAREWILTVRSSPLAATLLVAAAAFAEAPYRRPAVTVSFPRYQYSQSVRHIRDVDFRNIELVRLYPGRHKIVVQLKDGIGKWEEDGEVGLVQVHYFVPQEGIVVSNWLACVGSCSELGVVQVFGIEAERLTVLQQFEFDAQAPGSGAEFNSGTNTLTITGRSDDGSGHCCPKHVDVVSYNWDGKVFKQVSYRTVEIPKQP